MSQTVNGVKQMYTIHIHNETLTGNHVSSTEQC